jgi:hypothetical protein
VRKLDELVILKQLIESKISAMKILADEIKELTEKAKSL